jgi:hypothetical protein
MGYGSQTLSGTIGAEMDPSILRNLNRWKATATWMSTELEVPIGNPKTWSPQQPFLYDPTVRLKDDQGNTLDAVTSYFGMRSVKVGQVINESSGRNRQAIETHGIAGSPGFSSSQYPHSTKASNRNIKEW